jgi:hypothetical protein
MSAVPHLSGYHVQKGRSRATITLSTGDVVRGSFFVAATSSLGSVPERVADILNAEDGFLPFEVESDGGTRSILYNRAGIVTISLSDNEAGDVTGYDVATRCDIAVRLVDGRQLFGTVRIYRPEGRDRLSDWARAPERFRYLETDDATVLINLAHVIEISEAPRR